MAPPAQPSSQLQPGDVVADRYAVARLLGQGGMGEVYEARDTKLERDVALKVVLAAGSNDARRRLEAEAKAVAALEHPGIVTLHDVLEHGELVVLVLERVQGRSLRDMIATGPLAPRVVARVIAGVADALEAAHARGFVHRDVKPDNVILRPDGRTVLLDFGIAKAPRLALPISPTVTAEGTLVGTPAYLAPEQIRHEPVTAATDQFALAVMAYELCTARLPWNDASLPAIIASIVSDAPRTLHQPARDEDAAVDAVLARAMQKGPEARYESVTAFASALGAALGEDDAPRSPLPSAPAAKDSGRRARQELATITAPPESTPLPEPSRPPAASPSKELDPATHLTRAPRSRRTVVLGVALGAAAFAGALYWFGATKPSEPPASPASASVATPLAASSSVDLPEELPISGAQSEEDRTAYRDAVHALHIGALDDATAVLDAAIKRRPDFAGAALLRAYASFMRAVDLDEHGRAAFRAASAHRGQLSERDAKLLDALAPSFLDPPRWRESADLLDGFVGEHPRDVLAWEMLGFARTKVGDYPAADVAFAKELELDRTAALAYNLRAQFALARRDSAAATSLLETCSREVPAAVRCRVDVSVLLAASGRCREADREARDVLALAPDSPRALVVRASANATMGAPAEVVRGLLEKRRKLLPEELRSVAQIEDDYLLAKRSGDFDAALAALDAASTSAQSGGDVSRFTSLRAETLWEAGNKREAAELARKYLSLEATRPLPERGTSDATGRMLTFLHAAEELSAREYDVRREAWIAAWRARRTDVEWRSEVGFDVWSSAYGAVGLPSAQEAEAALKAAATLSIEPAPRSTVNVIASDVAPGRVVGALLLSAGRLDDAETLLRGATQSCVIAPDQIARLALGDLLERRGRTEEACAVYAQIEKDWGQAKPRSVTAKAARAAASKLGCK